jgi:hypothetical protein
LEIPTAEPVRRKSKAAFSENCRAYGARHKVSLVSNYHKTKVLRLFILIFILIAERLARTKLRPLTVESVQRHVLFDVETEDDICTTEEERYEKHFCLVCILWYSGTVKEILAQQGHLA